MKVLFFLAIPVLCAASQPSVAQQPDAEALGIIKKIVEAIEKNTEATTKNTAALDSIKSSISNNGVVFDVNLTSACGIAGCDGEAEKRAQSVCAELRFKSGKPSPWHSVTVTPPPSGGGLPPPSQVTYSKVICFN